MIAWCAIGRVFLAGALGLVLAAPAFAGERPLRDGQYCRYSFEQVGVSLVHTGGPPFLGIVRIDKLERPNHRVVGWLYHDTAGDVYVQANPRMSLALRQRFHVRFTDRMFGDVYSTTVRTSQATVAASGLHVAGCSESDSLTRGSQYEDARRTYGVAHD